MDINGEYLNIFLSQMETLNTEEGPTATQAEKRIKSTRKRGSRNEYRCRKAEFEPTDVQFDERADETTAERFRLHIHYIYMYFKSFATDNMFQLVADGNKRVRIQKQEKSESTTVKRDSAGSFYVHVHGFGADAQCKSLTGRRTQISP